MVLSSGDRVRAAIAVLIQLTGESQADLSATQALRPGHAQPQWSSNCAQHL